jgi:hypothetical protein
MALPALNPDAFRTTPIQQTAFSHDVIGRYVCNSWSEVAGDGGDPFDVVVIGAGMFGMRVPRTRSNRGWSTRPGQSKLVSMACRPCG